MQPGVDYRILGGRRVVCFIVSHRKSKIRDMKLPERSEKWALTDNNIILMLCLSAGSTRYTELYPRKAVAADFQQDVFLHKRMGKKKIQERN